MTAPQPSAGEKIIQVVVDSNGDLIYHGDAAEALGVEPHRQVTVAVRVLEVSEMPADELDDAIIRRV
jgi:hypothetical protein